MPINKVDPEEIKKVSEDFPLNFDEYQRLAVQFAVYPGQDTHMGLLYLATKLSGEAGELAGKVDDYGKGYAALGLSLHQKELITKEIGDILWYASALSMHLRIRLTAVMKARYAFPDINPLEITSLALRVCEKAGAVSESIGKALRDDDLAEEGDLRPERFDAIFRGLVQLMDYLVVISTATGTSLSAVAIENLQKLSSRSQRGVLQGSGDER